MGPRKKNSNGFTIVELLVVIIVIGILAAITIVSYSGIKKRADIVAIDSQLESQSRLIDLYTNEYGEPPTILDINNCAVAPYPDANYCVKGLNGSGLSYMSSANSYSLTISNNDIVRNISQDGIVSYPSYVKTWGGSNADSARGMAKTIDGGSIIVGNTDSYGAGGDDVIVIKYDSFGNLSWSKVWGGAGLDIGFGIIQTFDGGYAMTGMTSSYGAGSQDMFLVKLNSAGDVSWSKTWGGAGDDIGYSLMQDNNDDIIVSGQSANYGAGNTDAFITKFDATGAYFWSKTFGGGSSYEAIYSMIQDSNGDYVLSGTTGSFGAGSLDQFIIKCNSSGVFDWMRTLGGGLTDYGYGIVETVDGGYLTLGSTSSYGEGEFDTQITKVDSDGIFTWSRTWGGSGYEAPFNSVISTYDGGYIFTGSTDSYGDGGDDIYLVKFDSTGTLSWNKTLGGADSDLGFTAVQVSDGGIVVTGLLTGSGVNDSDIFLAKFKSDGTINNCLSPMCQNPTVIVNSPTPTVASQNPVLSSPNPDVVPQFPSTEIPSLINTVVVKP